MIASGEWPNPTRTVGLLAYGAAAVCCGIAWMRARSKRRNGRLAMLLMLIESVLLLDITFSWRWMLHQLFIDFAQRWHEYGVRRGPQIMVLIILAALLLLTLVAIRRFFHGRGAALAVSGAVLSLALWCIEVVSLHQVDHVLYHPLGPVLAISLLWIVACLMTATGILIGSLDTRPGHE
jgi:hypothetical protein